MSDQSEPSSMRADGWAFMTKFKQSLLCANFAKAPKNFHQEKHTYGGTERPCDSLGGKDLLKCLEHLENASHYVYQFTACDDGCNVQCSLYDRRIRNSWTQYV